LNRGKTEQARERLDGLLAGRNELPRSTVNEIAALRMRAACNLNELLVYAPRTPVGITDTTDPDELPDPSVKQLKPMFDRDGAALFSRWLPLNLLIEAARSPTLPLPLRGEVARAGWVRAILLGNGQAARDLAPWVVQSFPDLKPSLDRWIEAKSSDAAIFAAAFMMLRNSDLRFEVASGLGDIQGNYSAPGYPNFLSDTERKSADEEWQKLAAINAPNFLCGEALKQSTHQPDDERVPEALYLCLEAVHQGCANSQSDEFAKSAFRLLHHNYPGSSWADKGKYWYHGEGYCPGQPITSD
jgi:hypothetical protein